MTSRLAQPSPRFREIARIKLENAHVQGAIDTSVTRLMGHRLEAWGELGPEVVDELRDRAHDAKQRVIADLNGHVARFRAAVEERGGHTHLAASAEEASRIVVDICRNANAKLVAKSKSMASEEIALNPALEAAGMKVVETDLGEYLLQLKRTHPVHIVAPAIELTAGDCAEVLAAVDGVPVEPELEALTAKARGQLREVFLAADVGVTGANFAVADTGSIVLVTNEGNGRLVSALPRVHVAILTMERLVPNLQDLGVCLRLLARSATGQRLTTYTTVLTGPRREGETDGPEELHVVILDNGRSKLVGTKYQDMLACIRCGACLNVCPVYRKTAGAAYGPVYSGPMGAVLIPLLVGLDQAPALPHASSLCGHCTDVCPVRIPLHELLLELRADLVGRGIAPAVERLAFTAWSYAWSTPLGYRITTTLARLGQALAGAVGPGRVWAAGRALPRLGRLYRDSR